MAREVLTIVGTAVGSYFGYPQLGFALGSLAGAAFFPDKLPGIKGPRINDLQVQTSTIGAPIPIVYGKPQPFAGNIIWTSGLIETVHTEEVGGKGAPTQESTTYSYSTDVAVLICEGEIDGICRIWADDKLIYDVTLPEGVSDPSTVTDVMTAAFEALMRRVSASFPAKDRLTIYTGTATQNPDPTIESYLGVGNVPGYRHYAYVVFDNFQLADYGNRIPNFRFEVFKNGSVTNTNVTEYSNEELYPWSFGSDARNTLNDHRYQLSTIGNTEEEAYYTGPNGSTWTTTLNDVINADSRGAEFYPDNYCGYTLDQTSGNTNLGTGTNVSTSDRVTLYYNYNKVEPDMILGPPTNPGDNICDRAYERGLTQPGANAMFYLQASAYVSHLSYAAVFERAPYGETTAPEPWNFTVVCANPTYLRVSSNAVTKVERTVRAPRSLAALSEWHAIPSATDWYVNAFTGEIRYDAGWELHSTTYKVLQKYTTSGSPAVVTKYPLSPARPTGHAEYSDEAFWTNAYNAAVADGDMPPGLVYNVDYPVTQAYGYRRITDVSYCQHAPVTVKTVVDDLCDRVSLTNRDTSQLTETLEGYLLGSAMSVADAIEPLRQYAFFDAVDSDGVLKFVVRGGAIEATLTVDDMSAHLAGGQRPPIVEIARKQPVELPKTLRVHYPSTETDGEAGEQIASRMVVGNDNILDVNIPVLMSDQKASEIAQVLLYELWVNRNTYAFSVSTRWMGLEPTTCIEIPVDAALQRVRIISCDDQLLGPTRIEAVRDDADVYSPQATPAASSTGFTQAALPLVGPTELTILELPALRELDNQAGPYIAVRKILEGWQGAVVFRSPDSGATWTRVATLNSSAVVGDLVTVPVAPTGSGYDDDHSFEVELRGTSGTLASVTDASLAAGSNLFAVGANGRWVLGQFGTAVLTSGGIWSLSHLTLGLFDTDRYIDDLLVDDDFILMAGPGIAKVSIPSDRIGYEELYKAVSKGASLDSATEYPFTVQGLSYTASAVSNLSDVVITGSIPDNSTLRYDSSLSRWVPSLSGTTLDQLSDVALGSPLVNGMVLTYDSTTGTWYGALSSSTSLYDAILADAPNAYWKLDETSGTALADSSGNGHTMNISSSGYTVGKAAVVPSTDDKHLYFGTSVSGSATSGDKLGFTAPLSGDWTIEAVVSPQELTAPCRILSMTAAGETEATNYQFYLYIGTSGTVQVFWEYGAGTNQTVDSLIPTTLGRAHHIVAIKNSTAKTLTFYVNGVQNIVRAYSNEPTGGSSTNAYIGAEPAGNTGAMLIGHVAIYSSMLSEARVRAHARAAGFLPN